MEKLVLDHRYRLGMPWDNSPFRNHGVGTAVAAQHGGLGFNGATSDIHVPANPSLQNLGAVRARASFQLDAIGGGGARRYNIMEGHLSFALYVTPLFQLQGTYYAPDNTWKGAITAPGTIRPSTRYEVEFHYDGVSAATLAVNGVTAAASYDLMGPVRSVAAKGLHIGRWPDADQYVFRGTIWNAQVYKDDLEANARKYMDCCGFDRQYFLDVLERFREQKMTRKDLDKWTESIRDLASGFLRQNRQADPARVEEEARLRERLLEAYRRRDVRAMQQALEEARRTSALSDQEVSKLVRASTELVSQLPVEIDEVFEMAHRLCGMDSLLDALLRDPKGNPIHVPARGEREQERAARKRDKKVHELESITRDDVKKALDGLEDIVLEALRKKGGEHAKQS